MSRLDPNILRRMRDILNRPDHFIKPAIIGEAPAFAKDKKPVRYPGPDVRYFSYMALIKQAIHEVYHPYHHLDDSWYVDNISNALLEMGTFDFWDGKVEPLTNKLVCDIITDLLENGTPSTRDTD